METADLNRSGINTLEGIAEEIKQNTVKKHRKKSLKDCDFTHKWNLKTKQTTPQSND